jgi:dolichyl-phosphate-mannose--protein O-mannosyl transferase
MILHHDNKYLNTTKYILNDITLLLFITNR